VISLAFRIAGKSKLVASQFRIELISSSARAEPFVRPLAENSLFEVVLVSAAVLSAVSDFCAPTIAIATKAAEKIDANGFDTPLIVQAREGRPVLEG
jgi:hypothetical protein